MSKMTTAVSSLKSRTKAKRFPSGDQRGRASIPLVLVKRVAVPLCMSSNQSQPLEAIAICLPSGEGAGSVMPCAKMGNSCCSR